MSDLIDRQILKADLLCGDNTEHDYCFPCRRILECIDNQPAAETHDKRTEMHACDLIDRQALMKEFSDFVRASNNSDFAPTPTWNDAVSLVGSMPSAQPSSSCVHENDSISRQAAIDVLDRNHILGQGLLNDTLDHIADAIMALPSAKPDLQQTCNQLATDCISRQAAIDALDKEYRCTDRSDDWDGLKTAMLIIENLPSAQSDDDRLERCRFEYVNACKIIAHPTPDTSKSDIYDAHAVIKALHPIFGDVEF